ncbi:MAG: hypothetical protein WDO06_00890 [Actinomycetota bacterium]
MDELVQQMDVKTIFLIDLPQKARLLLHLPPIGPHATGKRKGPVPATTILFPTITPELFNKA